MAFIDSIKKRAKQNKKTIVLPETADMRTLEAAHKILQEGIADIILVGDKQTIIKKADGLDLTGAKFVDPYDCDKLNDYVSILVELRKKKGMTPEEAKELKKAEAEKAEKTENTESEEAAVNSSANVLRAALQILKTAPDTKLVSAFFLVVVPNCEMGEHGTFIFSDAGLNQFPDARELAAIAESSAKSFELLVEAEPIVAMLSHSTKGSAHHPEIDKVIEACRIVNEECPNLKCDGELQSDAAIVPEVAASKAPGSDVAGKANVLIFPDLDAGNIGYKLVQRLAKADAYGPITQGIAKPVNDLSRGCSADDIVGVVAITAVQAQALDQK